MELTPSEVAELGPGFHPQDFHLTPGRDYVAMGLQLSTGGRPHGAGVWIHLVSDYGRLGWAPAALFEIVDGSASRYWKARMEEGGFTLWPESFYREFYHDDLSEGVPEVTEDFVQVRTLLEAEAADRSP